MCLIIKFICIIFNTFFVLFQTQWGYYIYRLIFIFKDIVVQYMIQANMYYLQENTTLIQNYLQTNIRYAVKPQ